MIIKNIHSMHRYMIIKDMYSMHRYIMIITDMHSMHRYIMIIKVLGYWFSIGMSITNCLIAEDKESQFKF